MHYLGKFHGYGILIGTAGTTADVSYEFEGFTVKPGKVVCGGEIRLAPESLKHVFGGQDLQLLCADGRILSLWFTERKLPSGSTAAHVSVTGDLPSISEWRHESDAGLQSLTGNDG